MWCGVRMELLFFALVLMIGGRVVKVDGWHETAQCVQLGHANTNGNLNEGEYGILPNKYDAIPLYHPNRKEQNWIYTLGAYNLRTNYHFLGAGAKKLGEEEYDTLSKFDPPSGQSCPYKFEQGTYIFMDFCPTDALVEIRTYAVRQNGVIMPGWLHFEVELMDLSDVVYAVYVQVRDEWFNAIGEFVTNPAEACEATKKDLVMPTPYQVLPCSAIGFREAKVSYALWMTDPEMLTNKSSESFLTTTKLSEARGIHFTWRLSEYWCNRHLRFRPEAIVFTKKMKEHNDYTLGFPKPYRKAAAYWLFPKWYRSADIKLDGTTLRCDEKVIDYTNPVNGSNRTLEKLSDGMTISWLREEAEESTLDNDYIATQQLEYINESTFPKGVWSLKSCQANTRLDKVTRFAGRCTHHFQKTPSHDALQGCNLDGDAPEFQDPDLQGLQTYDNYLNILTINRTRQCSSPCRAPFNVSDLIAIQQFNTSGGPLKKPQVLKFTNIGATRHHSKVQKFWAGRKFHGQVLTFWTMFLIPVSTFASRYLKETMMPNVCIGFHTWFWIHIATTFLGTGMLGCGFLALYDLLNTFGRSLNEFSGIHRILGIYSMVIFILMMVLGGFRTFNRKVRKVLLFLHSFMGFSIYFVNLTAMVLSTWIPASPSIKDCDETDGRPFGLSGVALVTMVWVVVDILSHVGMTMLQYFVDRKYHIVRDGFYCPIVPFLPPESIKDLKGKNFRKIIFLVYMLICFIFAITVIFLLSGDSVPEICKNLTGNTTCDDRWGCSNWAKAYSHKYPAPTEPPQAAK